MQNTTQVSFFDKLKDFFRPNPNIEPLNKKLIEASKCGDLTAVKYLLTSPELSYHANSYAEEDMAFVLACGRGHLEVVKYLLTSPDLKWKATITAQSNRGLKDACGNGYLEVVRYLLASPDLKHHANIHASDDWALMNACINNHLDIVKYLLTSPELTEHITPKNSQALNYACRYGHLDIIDYLLYSPDLEEHIDLKTCAYEIFKTSYESAQWEVLKYLIIDCHLPFDINIQRYLADLNKMTPANVLKLFNTREMNKGLSEKLSHKTRTNKAVKI